MFRKLRRRVRILALLPAAVWLYRERHVLAGALGFARTVPDRVRLGRGEEVALAAKVNLALLKEPSLHGADVRLRAVQDGNVFLGVGAGSEAAGEEARRIVEQMPGVTSVRLEDDQTRPLPSDAAPSGEVAGQGVLADLQDGTAASATGDEAPVRI